MVGVVRTTPTSIAFVVALGVVAPAQATTTPEAIPLERGSVAPYTGLLLPPPRYIDLAETEIDLERCETARRADQDLARQIEATCLEHLDAARSGACADRCVFDRWLGFAIGIATTVIFTYVGARTIGALSP